VLQLDRLWPYLQTLDQAGKACEGQTFVNQGRKRFHNIGLRCYMTFNRMTLSSVQISIKLWHDSFREHQLKEIVSTIDLLIKVACSAKRQIMFTI
jgi:hypothetical protein